MIGGYGGGMLLPPPDSIWPYLFDVVVAVIFVGISLWNHNRILKLEQKEHHKNVDSIHRNEEHEEKPEGEDDLDLNAVTIIVLLSIFAIPAFAIVIGPGLGSGLVLIGWYLIIFLALCVFIISVNKHLDTYVRHGKNKLPDHKLTCINGHTVSVFPEPGGVINIGHHNLDVNDWASVWPEKCPICGAPWHRPGK